MCLPLARRRGAVHWLKAAGSRQQRDTTQGTLEEAVHPQHPLVGGGTHPMTAAAQHITTTGK
jgi:hypothetical protein